MANENPSDSSCAMKKNGGKQTKLTNCKIPKLNRPNTSKYMQAAFRDFVFGYQVIPLKPQSKIPALTWDPWLQKLSKVSILDHWTKNPTHELGIIVGDKVVVFDADTRESLAKLYELERVFDIVSNHIVKTAKGEHHYFKLADGVVARSNSYSTSLYPDRIDVKTGRSLIVRPPSKGKEMDIDEADSIDDLVEVSQEFIDAINLHNGMKIASEDEENDFSQFKGNFNNGNLKILSDLLEHISANCSHDVWIKIGAGLHNETSGNQEGLTLWDEWSKGGKTYPGYADLSYKYKSFKGHNGSKVSIGYLVKLAKESGADVGKILGQFEEPFEVCETEVISAEAYAKENESKNVVTKPSETKLTKSTVPPACNPLLEFSLLGQSTELEKAMLDDKFILGEIALNGQNTVIYAEFNAGKTLLMLFLIIESISAKAILGGNVYYVNADDNYRGLVQKLKLADEFGFHMLCPGHNNFKIMHLVESLSEMIINGTAKDTIVILDTLKKFTDLMDKRKSSKFGNIARQFVSKGGSIILLAHVNKKKNDDGKSIFEGTNDIINDADCAYILEEINVCKTELIKTVEFVNKKSRGSVTSKCAYQYSIAEKLSYEELISSVETVDKGDADTLRKESSGNPSDNENTRILGIVETINKGINTKIKLIKSVAKTTGDSQQKILKTIEKFTGSDPKHHKWNFHVGAKGANFYKLHPQIMPINKPSTI